MEVYSSEDTASGDTALHCAACKEDYACVKMMLGSLENRVHLCYQLLRKQNSEGETVLYCCQNVAMFDLLLKFLDGFLTSQLLTVVNNNNQTIFHKVLYDDNDEAFRMLLSKLQTKDKLAVLSVRDNANGWCVLDTIAWLGWNGTEPLAYLMEGIQPHELYTVLKTRDNRGETIIHHFVMMDIHKEVLEETMTTLTEYMQRELLDIEDMQGRSPY